ncbi:MAG: hypothetical protein OXC92_05160 [Flavobacteriaceae bacterium]|nr:hypothetical protein [Flavobacteriaceae bacterium]MCY4216357.1 hypothetical protein [Flavobacteriaceae bacterium]
MKNSTDKKHRTLEKGHPIKSKQTTIELLEIKEMEFKIERNKIKLKLIKLLSNVFKIVAIAWPTAMFGLMMTYILWVETKEPSVMIAIITSTSAMITVLTAILLGGRSRLNIDDKIKD